jgi:hypothetical protein
MDTFAFAVNYLNGFCTLMCTTIGLFEVHKITPLSMARQLCILLEINDLINCVITSLKDENSNLMSNIFKIRGLQRDNS